MVTATSADFPLGSAQENPEAPRVLVGELRGIINPVAARYVERIIGEGEEAGAALIVFKMDTPGGLDTSMREITQRILSSRVPVAIYVAPPGARAGSAGVFITYAAHVAAMAPSTNIGSAHPVMMGDGGTSEGSSDMMEKITNDAVASIRSVAENRGRNAEWAEKAVRESANLPASEALQLNVVDVVAEDLTDLLRQIDGRSVRVGIGSSILRIDGATIREAGMNPIERLLHVISDPTVAYLLLSLGGLALVYELANPGAILPGVVGGISLLLALYSLGTLPVNIAGVGLILFALLLFLADLMVAGTGFLTVGSVTSFLLGSLLLATSAESQAYVRVSLPAVLAMTVTFGGFFTFVAGSILRSRRRPAYTGSQALVDARGVARSEIGESGTAFVNGELWQATAADLSHPIPAGLHIRVVAVEGLRLTVRPE
jgi:membrane-bound serine protease (ClpP class)